jgi:hypothetical protein
VCTEVGRRWVAHLWSRWDLALWRPAGARAERGQAGFRFRAATTTAALKLHAAKNADSPTTAPSTRSPRGPDPKTRAKHAQAGCRIVQGASPEGRCSFTGRRRPVQPRADSTRSGTGDVGQNVPFGLEFSSVAVEIRR